MATKRPHFVPRVYLNAWANGQSQVAYRRRDMPQAVVSSTINVAVAGGIYGAGEISEAREKFFNDLEADWPSLRHQLKMDRNLTGDRRQLMAVYLAIQLARTVHHRNQAQFMIDLAAKTTERPIPADVVREHLRELDGGDDPDENEVQTVRDLLEGSPSAPTGDQAHSMAMQVATEMVAPRLESMRWCVYDFGRPILITSDRPVQLWRRVGSGPEVGGVGVENADQIRFALSPSTLLVMSREPLNPTQLPNPRSINADTFRDCHQFVVGTPQSRHALSALDLAPQSPRLRFRTGPGYATGPDGTNQYVGEALHTYVS